jgi:hypothetical protein
MNLAFSMRTRANKETRACGGRDFQRAPRGRRIIGPQTLCACRIRTATLSESVKIQNQKLPLDDANIECVANDLSGAAVPESKLSV